MRQVKTLLKELEVHQKGYQKVKRKLKSLYRYYSNEREIVDLFEYWILSSYLINRSYGSNGLKEYLKGSQKDPIVFSYEYEFKAKTGLVNQAKPIDIKYLFELLSFFPLSLRFPGAPRITFFDSIRGKYTNLLSRSLPICKDENLERDIVEIVNIYFSEVKINIKLSDSEYLFIPRVFRSKQLGRISFKVLNVKCAPVELMHFNGYENIFLLKNKLKIFGFQHGGGYDNASVDLNLFFEKNIERILWMGISRNQYSSAQVC